MGIASPLQPQSPPRSKRASLGGRQRLRAAPRAGRTQNFPSPWLGRTVHPGAAAAGQSQPGTAAGAREAPADPDPPRALPRAAGPAPGAGRRWDGEGSAGRRRCEPEAPGTGSAAGTEGGSAAWRGSARGAAVAPVSAGCFGGGGGGCGQGEVGLRLPALRWELPAGITEARGRSPCPVPGRPPTIPGAGQGAWSAPAAGRRGPAPPWWRLGSVSPPCRSPLPIPSHAGPCVPHPSSPPVRPPMARAGGRAGCRGERSCQCHLQPCRPGQGQPSRESGRLKDGSAGCCVRAT